MIIHLPVDHPNFTQFSLEFYIHFISILWKELSFQKDLFHLFSFLYSIFYSQSNAYTLSFIPSLLYHDSFVHDCPKYFPPSPDLSPYSTSLVNEFISSFSVIDHLHTYTNLYTAIIPDHYTSLLLTSATYKHLLLEGCFLVPTIAD